MLSQTMFERTFEVQDFLGIRAGVGRKDVVLKGLKFRFFSDCGLSLGLYLAKYF